MTIPIKLTLALALSLVLSLTLATHQASAFINIDKLTLTFETEETEEVEFSLTRAEQEKALFTLQKVTQTHPLKPNHLQRHIYWAQAPPVNII